MNCFECGTAFEAKREHALFCSDACRVKNYRKLKKATTHFAAGDCEHCGGSLVGKRAGARFCSEKCRAASWNAAQPRHPATHETRSLAARLVKYQRMVRQGTLSPEDFQRIEEGMRSAEDRD
jgi:predicted nucleic acid-binding Zn ribbon protein